MADLYRKAALDKLSSPEQLDKAITIISPSFWIAAIGGALIIAVALVWSIFGRLPVNVSANGIYMGMGGIHSVVAEADGIVEDVYVSEGDDVSAGQKIAKLDDSDLRDELDTLKQRRGSVEAVTFYSYDDEATADNKTLIDIKSQAVTTGAGLTTNQELLRAKSRQLSKQRSQTRTAKAKQSNAKSAYKRANKKYISASKKYSEASEKYNSVSAAYNEFKQAIGTNPTEEQKKQLEELEKAVAKANTDMDNAKNSAANAESAVKTAEASYSAAAQNYNTNLSAQKGLQDAVSQLEAQVRAERKNKGNQDTSIEMQFDSAKESALDQIDKEIHTQNKKIEAMTLTSRVDGKISGLNIADGNVVQAGTTVCRVAGEDSDGVICYIPVSEGKKIRTGMKAVVYPSTVNRQEYGHMEGTITAISDYVVSAEDMQNQLGDQTLVQSFQQSGPVIRATIDLKRDKDTVSGYYWSSKKGSDIHIDEGTIISADIVSEEKAPITMLIPLLKEKLSVKRDSEQNTAGTQSRTQPQQAAQGAN